MSTYNWRRNDRLFTEFQTGDTYVGLYVKRVGNLARVNVADAAITVPIVGKYRPWPGDPVLLEWRRGRIYMAGPAVAKSVTGIVKAVANPYVTVLCDQKTYVLPYAVAYTPAVGDRVGIEWADDESYVTGAISATTTPGQQDEKITLDQHDFELTFFAKQSGSFKAGKLWTSNVYADDADVAAWWYGHTIRDSIKDDAFIRSVEIYLPLISRKGAQPNIGRHTDDAYSTTTGEPYLTDLATRGWKGWIPLPTAWGDLWKTGAGGVGIHHGGTSLYRGRAEDKQSGKLRIRGRQ